MTLKNLLSSAARRVLRVKRLWALLWVFHLALAASVALPLGTLVGENVARSVWASDLARHFDLAWAIEAMEFWRGIPSVTTGYAFAAAALFAVLANAFFAGGGITILADESQPYTPRRFYEGCGRFFWRFFRLLLVSLVCYALVMVVNAILAKIAGKIWGEGMAAAPQVFFGYFRMVLMIGLLALVNMVFDYAKIRIILENRRSAFGAAVWAWKFVFRNFARTAGLFASLLGLGLLFALAYWAVRAVLPESAVGWLLLVALFQQALVLARLWLRLMFWSSQTLVYDELLPRYRPAPQPVFSL
jgi:hypothetical protein